MRYKMSMILISLCLIFGLSGCGKASGEIDSSEFVKYDIELVMPKIEYSICNTTELIIVYFPVVTNKEITGTELGGVAVKLPIEKGNTKVVLSPMIQDKINFSYQDKYVSFLKYRVDVNNTKSLKPNESVILCDTMLWIYHDSEFQKLQVDEDYLQITIVENKDEMYFPDWEDIIAKMRTNIEFHLQ